MITRGCARGGRRWRRHTIAWATTLLVLSCGNPAGVDLAPAPDVSAVAVDPAASTVTVGAALSLRAAVMDGSGHAISGAPIIWSVRDPTIASVSTAGMVTGRAVGTTLVAASAGGKSGTASISVQPAPVATISIQPSSATVTVGQTATLDVVLQDATGTLLDRTDRPVIWSSSDDAVASVSAAGVVTGVAPGKATISAAREGVSGSSVVTVIMAPVDRVTVQPDAASLIVGESTTLAVTVTDAGGAPLANRAAIWTSSDAKVATVTQAGNVTAVGAGSATITATVEGKTGSAIISVVRAPVLTVSVEPATLSLPSGQSSPLTITVTDANHVIVTDRDVTWTSSNSLVAAVSANGTVSALAPGSATITATSEGKSATAQVIVTSAAVGAVTVLPASLSVMVGQTTTLSATVTDANGAIVTDRIVTWSSSNTAVATVSATGVATGVSVGSATVTAISEGKSGSAALTVTAVPVGSVTVQPSTANLTVGQTAVLSTVVKDANGTVVTDRPITWVSGNALVATVSPTGVVTAKAPGSATISASAGGKSGSATVTVTPGPAAVVTLIPAITTVQVNKSVQLTASAVDANGNPITGRPFEWKTSDSRIATVTTAGLVKGVKAGSITITATMDGKTDSSVVTVLP